MNLKRKTKLAFFFIYYRLDIFMDFWNNDGETIYHDLYNYLKKLKKEIDKRLPGINMKKGRISIENEFDEFVDILIFHYNHYYKILTHPCVSLDDTFESKMMLLQVSNKDFKHLYPIDWKHKDMVSSEFRRKFKKVLGDTEWNKWVWSIYK